MGVPLERGDWPRGQMISLDKLFVPIGGDAPSPSRCILFHFTSGKRFDSFEKKMQIVINVFCLVSYIFTCAALQFYFYEASRYVHMFVHFILLQRLIA